MLSKFSREMVSNLEFHTLSNYKLNLMIKKQVFLFYKTLSTYTPWTFSQEAGGYGLSPILEKPSVSVLCPAKNSLTMEERVKGY